MACTSSYRPFPFLKRNKNFRLRCRYGKSGIIPSLARNDPAAKLCQVLPEEIKLTQRNAHQHYRQWPQDRYHQQIGYHPKNAALYGSQIDELVRRAAADAAANGEGAENKRYPSGTYSPFILKSFKHDTAINIFR